jgi:hypothetical protein
MMRPNEVLSIEIHAPTYCDPVDVRADRGRRARIAAALRDIAARIEQGASDGTLERPDLSASFDLHLPPSTASAA